MVNKINKKKSIRKVLDKIKIFLSRNKKISYVIGGIVLGTAIIGGAFSYSRKSDVIYDGVIDGKNVSYIEYADGTNSMTVHKSNITLKYFDEENTTRIDWNAEKEPQYANDILERVKDTRTGRIYRSVNVSDDTLEGKAAKNLLDKSNAQYNILRKQIREKKRAEYQQSLNSLETFFQ